MQLLFDFSEEGNVDCLGIVRGRVKRLPDGVMIPHIGWNRLDAGQYAYFAHSYVCVPDDPRVVTMTARHGASSAGHSTAELLWRPMAPRKIGRDRRPAPPLLRNPMQVIPAIDVLDGKVVRLVQGDFARVTVFGDDPLEIAEHYRRAGAERLHLVNLSAARDGRGDGGFLELGFPGFPNIEVQVGGGIRDLPAVARALEAGAAAVVIGTMLFAEPEAVRSALDLFGRASVIAALDTDGGEVKVHGWQAGSGQSFAAALRWVEELGISQAAHYRYFARRHGQRPQRRALRRMDAALLRASHHGQRRRPRRVGHPRARGGRMQCGGRRPRTAGQLCLAGLAGFSRACATAS